MSARGILVPDNHLDSTAGSTPDSLATDRRLCFSIDFATTFLSVSLTDMTVFQVLGLPSSLLFDNNTTRVYRGSSSHFPSFSMLYLVTIPFELQNGSYRCDEISHEEAGKLISNANESGNLKSFVNFASTKFAIRELCGVKVEVVQKVNLPTLKEGDSLLHCRVVQKSKGERIGLSDLNFFQVEFIS